MLNPDQKLNPKIFDEDVEVFSMRNGFGNGIVEEIGRRLNSSH